VDYITNAAARREKEARAEIERLRADVARFTPVNEELRAEVKRLRVNLQTTVENRDAWMERAVQYRREVERLLHERDAADAAAERTLLEVDRLRDRSAEYAAAITNAETLSQNNEWLRNENDHLVSRFRAVLDERDRLNTALAHIREATNAHGIFTLADDALEGR
jgi:chromosome segregation ATPase